MKTGLMLACAAFNVFLVMEDICDKLKILNYEQTFCVQRVRVDHTQRPCISNVLMLAFPIHRNSGR